MRGWFFQSHRHSLASRGISTNKYYRVKGEPRKLKGRERKHGKLPERIPITPGQDPEEALRRFAVSDLPKHEQLRVARLEGELESIKGKAEFGDLTREDTLRKAEIQEELRVARGIGPRKVTPVALLTDTQVLSSIPREKLLASFTEAEREEIQKLPVNIRGSVILARLSPESKAELVTQQRMRGLPEFKKPAEVLAQRSAEEEAGLLKRLEKLQAKQERAQAALAPQPTELKTGAVPGAKSALAREPVEKKVERQAEIEAARLAALERAREGRTLTPKQRKEAIEAPSIEVAQMTKQEREEFEKAKEVRNARK